MNKTFIVSDRKVEVFRQALKFHLAGKCKEISVLPLDHERFTVIAEFQNKEDIIRADDVLFGIECAIKPEPPPALDPQGMLLAEAMHGKMCRHNHTDGCSWFYDDWGKLPLDYSRKEYYEKALKVLKIVTLERALKIIEVL